MNVFFLSHYPDECARQHCDKHVVKMIIEYGQLLSTAHRLLDGTMFTVIQNGRRKKVWSLSDPNTPIYAASHVNHPDAVWARESRGNYLWLMNLFLELCKEYTHRYGREHATYVKLHRAISQHPRNIPFGLFAEPPKCMPDEYKVDDVVHSYRNFYLGSKVRFARWTNRNAPHWFRNAIEDYDEAHFERTRAVAR